jgi:hypothetical protein
MRFVADAHTTMHHDPPAEAELRRYQRAIIARAER